MKGKPTKATNNTKPSVAAAAAPPPTHSNLLGKVDLDDEDDLLSKYQTKKPLIELNGNGHQDEFTSSLNKFNSNIQTMIDSKWNQYKKSFQHDDEEQQEEEEEEDLYPTSRQRTSSRSSAIHSKVPSIQPKRVCRSLTIDFINNKYSF